MFKRFLVSASQPKDISSFLKDRLPYVFIYILFLSILAVLPNIIVLSTQNSFNKDVVKGMENVFYSADVDAEILDYKLNAEVMALSAITDTYSVAIHDTVVAMGFVFNFKEDHIEFHMGPLNKKSYPYQELNLESLDFAMKTTEDKEKLSNALTMIYQDVKGVVSISTSISLVISELLLAILFIFISVWSYSYSIPKLKLRYRFVLSSYSYTIYFIFVLLANLYDIAFLRLIGIILAFSFMRKAFVYLISQRKEDKRV